MATNKKSIVFIIIISLLALIFVPYIWWLANRVPGNDGLAPKVDFVSAQITNINDEEIDLKISSLMLNNFPFTVQAEQLGFRIYFDSLLLIKNHMENGIKLKGMDSTILFIPAKIKADSIKAFLTYIKTHPDVDSIDIKIVSELKLQLPIFGERTYEFENVKRIAPIRMPEIGIGKVDLEKFGLKESVLKLQLEAKNLNPKEISLLNAHYRFTVDGQKTITGRLEDLHLPAKGRDTVIAELDIKTLKLGKLGWKYLFDKKDTHFLLQIQGRLKLNEKEVTDSELKISVAGTLQELKDAVGFFSGNQ